MDLSAYKRDTYSTVLRAVFLKPMNWEVSTILGKLRSALDISDEVDKELKQLIRNDPEITSLNKGYLYMGHGGGGGVPMQGSMSRTHRGAQAPAHAGRPRAYPAQGADMLSDLTGRSSLGSQRSSGALHDRSLGGLHLAAAGPALAKPLGNSRGRPASGSISMRDMAPDGLPGMRGASPSLSNKSKKAKGPGLTLSQMIQKANPDNIDLVNGDLVGLRCERFIRSGQGYSQGWYEGLIAKTRPSANGQVCDILYDWTKAKPTWELDCTFSKSKALKEWRFLAEPRILLDWDNLQPPRTPGGSGKGGKSGAGGGGSKKRKASGAAGRSAGAHGSADFAPEFMRADPVEVQLPYSEAAIQSAITASNITGSPFEIKHMLAQLQRYRLTLIDSNARLELAARLEAKDHEAVEADLVAELDQKRAELAELRRL